MIQLTGVVTCATKDELEEVKSNLLHIPDVKFEQIGNRIDAYYTPDVTDSNLAIGNTIKKILEALECAAEHGFSLIF